MKTFEKEKSNQVNKVNVVICTILIHSHMQDTLTHVDEAAHAPEAGACLLEVLFKTIINVYIIFIIFNIPIIIIIIIIIRIIIIIIPIKITIFFRWTMTWCLDICVAFLMPHWSGLWLVEQKIILDPKLKIKGILLNFFGGGLKPYFAQQCRNIYTISDSWVCSHVLPWVSRSKLVCEKWAAFLLSSLNLF